MNYKRENMYLTSNGDYVFPPHGSDTSDSLSDYERRNQCKVTPPHTKRHYNKLRGYQSDGAESRSSVLPPVGVFWDIENCQIPHGKSALVVAQAIRDRFFDGYREAEFLVVCDVKKESEQVIQELNDAQVSLMHVCSKSKNAADEKLRQAMRRFGDTYSFPSAIILISSDINFATDLSDLRHRKKIHIILLHANNCSESLIMCANEHYNFGELVNPLPFRGQNQDQTAQIIIYNLPYNCDVKKVKARLKFLSQNCGGKIYQVFDSYAVLTFSTMDAASRACKRMEGETIFGNQITVGPPQSSIWPRSDAQNVQKPLNNLMPFWYKSEDSSPCKNGENPYLQNLSSSPVFKNLDRKKNLLTQSFKTNEKPLSTSNPLELPIEKISAQSKEFEKQFRSNQKPNCKKVETKVEPTLKMAAKLIPPPVEKAKTPQLSKTPSTNGSEPETPSSEKNKQFCEKHDNSTEGSDQYHSVLVDLDIFSKNVVKLLDSHKNYIPLKSSEEPRVALTRCLNEKILKYPGPKLETIWKAQIHRTNKVKYTGLFYKCYTSEFGKLNKNKEGVHLEHLITCVNYVKLTESNNVKFLESSTKPVLEKDFLETSKELSNPLLILSHEVVGLLKIQPKCIIPFDLFVPLYHQYYDKQCRLLDYGFTRLISLLQALPDIQVLGESKYRILTLTHQAQIKRFYIDLERVLKLEPLKKILFSQLKSRFENVLGQPFNPVNYGVCYIDDLLKSVSSKIHIFPVGNDKFIYLKGDLHPDDMGKVLSNETKVKVIKKDALPIEKISEMTQAFEKFRSTIKPIIKAEAINVTPLKAMTIKNEPEPVLQKETDQDSLWKMAQSIPIDKLPNLVETPKLSSSSTDGQSDSSKTSSKNILVTNDKVQEFCTKHDTCRNSGQDVYKFPVVLISLKAFSKNVYKLLESHKTFIPLYSFYKCYLHEIGDLPINENGVDLEHLISCVENIHICETNGIKYIKASHKSESNKDDFQTSADTKLPRALAIFSDEVYDILKIQPKCQIPFEKFYSLYQQYYEKSIKLSTYGFTRLIKLLEYLPDIQVTGQNVHRMVTLTHKAQVRRFYINLGVVLKFQPSKKLLLSQLPSTFENVLCHPFRPVDYGVCYVDDLLECISKKIHIFTVGNDKLLFLRVNPSEDLVWF